MKIGSDFGISTHCLAGVAPADHLPLFAKHGFAIVELNLGYWPWLADGARFGELRALFAGRGLRLWAYHMPYGQTVPEAGNIDLAHPDPAVRANTVAAVALGLERVADLGGARLVIHPNVAHLQPGQRGEALDLCRQTLRECAAALEALRGRRPEAAAIRLAVEPMPPWGLLNGAAEVEALLGAMDPAAVGLCLDVNHVNLAGQDPCRYVRGIAGRVCTTHLSDNDGRDERHWAPGRGCLPWTELLAELVLGGYKGPLIFETGQFGADAEDTVAQLAAVRETLKRGESPSGGAA